jgi:hypothetical protein
MFPYWILDHIAILISTCMLFSYAPIVYRQQCPSINAQRFHMRPFPLELFITRQLVVQAQLREVSNFHPLGTEEDATLGSAREVLGPVHAAVVLTCRLVEGHAHPGSNAGDIRNLAYKRHNAAAVIVRGQDAAAETLLDAWRVGVSQMILIYRWSLGKFTSGFDFLERSVNFGLFDFRRVGIEAAEFLRLLPG